MLYSCYTGIEYAIARRVYTIYRAQCAYIQKYDVDYPRKLYSQFIGDVI